MEKTQLNGALGPSSPRVDPLDYPSEACPECGNEVFVPGVIFKKVPGVLLGQGTETVPVPIKVFVCSKCGKLSPADQEIIDKHAKDMEQSKKSNLIL